MKPELVFSDDCVSVANWRLPFDDFSSRQYNLFAKFSSRKYHFSMTKMSSRQTREDYGLDDSSDLEDSWAAESVMFDASPVSRKTAGSNPCSVAGYVSK